MVGQTVRLKYWLQSWHKINKWVILKAPGSAWVAGDLGLRKFSKQNKTKKFRKLFLHGTYGYHGSSVLYLSLCLISFCSSICEYIQCISQKRDEPLVHPWSLLSSLWDWMIIHNKERLIKLLQPKPLKAFIVLQFAYVPSVWSCHTLTLQLSLSALWSALRAGKHLPRPAAPQMNMTALYSGLMTQVLCGWIAGSEDRKGSFCKKQSLDEQKNIRDRRSCLAHSSEIFWWFLSLRQLCRDGPPKAERRGLETSIWPLFFHREGDDFPVHYTICLALSSTFL